MSPFRWVEGFLSLALLLANVSSSTATLQNLPALRATHVRETLNDEGVWMIVEPFAHDRLEENLNPIGRMYYAASTQICTPASLSQEVGLALDNQAGEARLREVVTAGGFTRFRRATETPFNLVFEARP
jgi:hypothetical protein